VSLSNFLSLNIEFQADIIRIDEPKGEAEISGFVKYSYVEPYFSKDLKNKYFPLRADGTLFSNCLEVEVSECQSGDGEITANKNSSKAGGKVGEKVLAKKIGYTTTIPLLFQYDLFPFDVQLMELSLQLDDKIMINSAATEVKIVSVFNQKSEWGSYFELNGVMRAVFEAGRCDISDLTMKMVIIRKPKFIVINIIFPLAVIIGIGMLLYAAQTTDFSSRSGIVVTLLLTVMALKFTASTLIPLCDQITILDWYVLFCFGQLVFAMIGIGAVANISENSLALSVDRFFLSFYVASWIISNGVLLYRYFNHLNERIDQNQISTLLKSAKKVPCADDTTYCKYWNDNHIEVAVDLKNEPEPQN
jgi:hypothetical protein